MAKSTSKTSVKSASKPAEMKKTNYMKTFFIFWGVIFAIGLIAVAAFKAPAMVLIVIPVVAAFSFALMMGQMLQQWEGTVQEIKTEKETRSSGEDDWVTEEVTYAYVKLTNGKIKKVRSGGWKVGDHLKKEKGDMNVKVL
jgi:hypothetical protein